MSLHPIMSMALGPFAPIQQQHKATIGWRRTFLAANDARQYEAGYAHWPEPMPDAVALSAPYSTGWFDREADEQFRNDARRAERMDEDHQQEDAA
jgi:hypothetical protein